MNQFETKEGKLGRTSEWLPKAIEAMQKGDVETNSRLLCDTPLRGEIVNTTRIIGTERNLEAKPDSLEKRILQHTAQLGSRVFTTYHESSPLIEAAKDANKGIPSDVLTRIAFNPELTPHAQSLLCSAARNAGEILEGYATNLEEYALRNGLYDELRGAIFEAVDHLAGSRYVLETIRERADHAVLQEVDDSLDETMIGLIELSNRVTGVERENAPLNSSYVELMFKIADLKDKSREMKQASLDLAI